MYINYVRKRNCSGGIVSWMINTLHVDFQVPLGQVIGLKTAKFAAAQVSPLHDIEIK